MGVQVKVSGGGCIFLALLCMVLPLKWIVSAVAAAIFHELCHIGVVELAGGTISNLEIGPTGAAMDVSNLTVWQELVCAVAGPLGSLSLILSAEYVPEIALCGMIQGIYNLLPIYPLDGGRILSCGVQMLFSQEAADRVCTVVQWGTITMILFVGIWCALRLNLGIFPVLVPVFLLSKTMTGKIPCKQRKQRVQ